MQAQFTPGNLVKARGREWVVLPDSTQELLMVRPIGGLDDEVVGICTAIEDVASSTFPPPSWEMPGDYNACRLLVTPPAYRLAARPGHSAASPRLPSSPVPTNSCRS